MVPAPAHVSHDSHPDICSMLLMVVPAEGIGVAGVPGAAGAVGVGLATPGAEDVPPHPALATIAAAIKTKAGWRRGAEIMSHL